MKNEEIRNMTKDELINRLNDLEQEYLNLRFQKAVKPLTNTNKPREVRKEIARVKTMLKEKELKGTI